MQLREFVEYARSAHRGGRGAWPKQPLLYMNGLDVFEAQPGLWDASYDQMPSVIHNLTRRAYEALHEQSQLPASDVEPRVRSLVKLFCGPTAAVTRLHQDNFRAHAWLHQLAGRKLCAVPDAPVTTPTTCSTTSATRLPRRASLP